MPIFFKSGFNASEKKSFRAASFILVLVIAAVSILCIFTTRSPIDVTIFDGEKTVTLITGQTNPRTIVEKAGFNLDVNDELILDDFSEDNGGTIEINRSKLVRVESDGNVAYVLAYDDTVSEIIDKSGFTIEKDDVIDAGQDVSTSEEVYDGMQVYIKTAYTITISHDGTQDKVTMVGGTVKDALDKAEITVTEDDIVSPSLDSKLIGDASITVKRVKYVTRTEKESIPYFTKTEQNSDMYVNETKITTEGVEGTKELIYLDKVVDGVVTSSVFKGEKVTSEPVTKVINVGTKRINHISAYEGNGAAISEMDVPSSVKLDENGVPVNYNYVIRGKATAYTGDPITATGTVPFPGEIAVDPTEIPYGSKLYIVSADGKYVYGYAIATDTGGFVEMGNADIDLFMNTEEMCEEWGNRQVVIYVLN